MRERELVKKLKVRTQSRVISTARDIVATQQSLCMRPSIHLWSSELLVKSREVKKHNDKHLLYLRSNPERERLVKVSKLYLGVV